MVPEGGKKLPLANPEHTQPYHSFVVGPSKVRRVLKVHAYLPGSKKPAVSVQIVQLPPGATPE